MSKILVIEDEEVLRTLISGELRQHGYEVLEAADGQQGWEVIQVQHPDLILLDLLMPVMTGYDVLQHLRADEQVKEIPCIVISNSGQVDDLNRAFDFGANDVLIKADFNPDQLVLKVAELLAKAHPEE